MNRQRRVNPNAQFTTTFNNNSGKILKYNTDKYNAQGSLNNTASSSFQNQQKNILNNNNFNYTQKNQNQEYLFPPGSKHNASANINNNKKMQEKYLEKEILDPFIMDCNGEKPLSRFGHSLVMINPLKVCLFGGAVGETRKINYSNDTYIYNIMTKLWIKLNVNSNMTLPSERAAHAAAVNDNMQMLIYGGSNSSGLVDDKLWMLHLSDQNEGMWSEVRVVGPTPGPRYGHSLSFLNPYFVLFGGNFNPNLNNDVWIINTKNNQIQWEKVDCGNIVPCPRLYHTCCICPYGNCLGMMIIFGGRDSNEKPLNDIWGLTRHRDGNWTWSKAEFKDGYEMKPRYNHSMIFYNSLMIVLGGRGIHSTYNGNNPLPIEVFNTETNDGFEFPGITMNRQTNFIYDKNIFLFGGFDSKNPQRPLGNLYRISLEKLFEKNMVLKDLFNNKNKKEYVHKINTNKNINNQNNNKKMQFRLTQDVVIGSGGIIQENDEEQFTEDPSSYHKISLNKLPEENKRIGDVSENKGINSLLLNKHEYNEALIDKFIQTLLRPFDWFDKKMDEIHSNLPFNDNDIHELIEGVKPILEKDRSLIRIRSPCKIFGNLYGIYNDLMRYFESYGNPSDDNQMGDITVMQYIFLGDFCDRGYNSLEVILLLFALKIKYPEFIYIIRGHHEDKYINEDYGLGEECIERLSDDIRDPFSIFANINKAFDLLPFGVLVDNNILLVHGGIGSSINTLDDIDSIKRPIEVVHNVTNNEQLKVIDLLWSEYCDDIENIDVNVERDKLKKGFIVKYGKNRLNKFLDENKINLLITSHQFVKGGFTTFNNDRLLIVFSATNYMNKYGNVGGMITIAKKNANKRMNIIPKLITFNNTKEDTYRREKSPSPVRINKNN